MSAWVDKAIVEKVVFNLLSNAMKFTPNNGKVVFSLSRCTFAELPSEQQAELNKMPADTKFACLSVIDSGKGITEEDMKNIFAPFYQGEDDNKENVGTGHAQSYFCIKALFPYPIISLQVRSSRFIFRSAILSTTRSSWWRMMKSR